MLTLRDAPRDQEAGFTLVELVISMVLLMVVVGSIVVGVTQLGRGNASMSSQRKAQRDAIDAMEQIRQDINLARSPALASFEDRRDVLRDLVVFQSDSGSGSDLSRRACDGARGHAYVSCLTTITVARPNELWFRANVDSTNQALAECVGYVVSGRSLTRYVNTNWRNCGPASRTGAVSTVLVHAARTAPTTATRRNAFSYTLRRHPRIPRHGYVDPSGCRSTLVSDASGSSAYVASVEIDLRALTRSGAGLAEAGVRSSAPVNAHATGDYAFAVGCAA